MGLKIIKEFKEFAIKGNMIDIAIGVIIGAAFNKVIDVIVREIFLPPLAFITDGNPWEHKKIILRKAVATPSENIQEIAIGYGKLIAAGIDFLVIAITVFLVVKIMNNIRNKAEDPQNTAETTPKDIELLNDISESMKKQVQLLEDLIADRSS